MQTSIDMRVQLAASRAVATVTGFKVAMVAIRPSTGEVLAVVNKPGGFNRALLGTYPPGSTFKMITASALAVAGMRPSSTVQCPATIDIGGRTFHNFDFEQLGTVQPAHRVRRLLQHHLRRPGCPASRRRAARRDGQ